MTSMTLGGIPVAAQAQQDRAIEEIVVTGSRIVRRDQISNSPIVTVEAEQFQAQHGLNFEAYLNQLPNYNPAATPTVLVGPGGNSDVQITPVNSVGIASLSLRGFGPNRSLVLVNGRRLTPVNALMVTDLNAVPSALIQRVETITGGASAVYGADALGGVTNFILRDNFEGFHFDAQHGVTTEGGGAESRISAVFGANLEGGRGNVSIGLEYYDREAVLEIDRDAFTARYNDPSAPGYFAFLVGTTGYNCAASPYDAPGQANCPSAAGTEGIFADRPAGTEVFNPFLPGIPAFRPYTFNADGTIFVPNSAAGLSKYVRGDSPHYDYYYPLTIFDSSVPGNTQTIEGLKWHNDRAQVSSPQSRHSFFASGSYDITDSVRVFARGMMAESETRTVLFGTSVIFGWETSIPYNPVTDSPLDPGLDWTDAAVIAAAVADPTNPAYANPDFIATGQPGAQHPVPVELAALLNTRPFPTRDWIPAWNPDQSLDPRSTRNTNSLWQVEAGIEFDLPMRDWTGELYLSQGESATYNNAFGNLSLTRYRALTRQPDYGRGAAVSGNIVGSPQTGTPASPGFGAADITCTSGFYDTYFHGDVPLSQDCFEAINATLQTRASNSQSIAELNFQGSLADLPAGDLRMAVGLQRRENSARFVPDILQSTVSFTDQVVGVYPTGYMDASTSVDDIYMEMLVPLVSGRRGFEQLDLELGVRVSDYEHTDTETTYKALFNWQPNNWLRFRGGFNRATRAPNLGEMFLATQEVFQIGGNNFGDPCGLRSISPFGAGGTGPDPVLQPGETEPELAAGQTAEGAQSARLICEAQMGPAAADQWYFVNDAVGGAGGLFNWNLQSGNPNLKSETGDSWTFGLVMNSPFQRPWLRGATLSLDYYRIHIEDAIMQFSVDFANFRCYGAVTVSNAAEAAAQSASPECRLVARNQATGGPLTNAISYDNQATIKTAGMDIGLNWMLQFSDTGSRLPGGIGVTLQATLLDYYRTRQSPAVFDVETEWKGSLGPNLSGTNPGAYDYRLFSSLSYFHNDWSVSLRWRHLPSVWTAAYASQQAVIANNNRVAAGGEGILLSYNPTTERKTSSYDVFDLSFNYRVNGSFALRGGITNLLDKWPIAVGSTQGFPIGTDLGSICGGAPGCVNPGAPSLPVTGAFNGGYYDTMGRRLFVGFDVRF